MRLLSTLLGGLAVAGIAAAAGSAFTNSNDVTALGSPTIGYSTTSVSGGTVDSLTYNLNADGTNVDTVTLVLHTDTSALHVHIAFNAGPMKPCHGPVVAAGATTYTCDEDGSGGLFTQTTTGLTATHVIINSTS